MNELLVKIRFLIPSLPRAEKAFAQALLENPEAITQLTLAAIAAESGSSEAQLSLLQTDGISRIFRAEGGVYSGDCRGRGNP